MNNAANMYTNNDSIHSSAGIFVFAPSGTALAYSNVSNSGNLTSSMKPASRPTPLQLLWAGCRGTAQVVITNSGTIKSYEEGIDAAATAFASGLGSNAGDSHRGCDRSSTAEHYLFAGRCHSKPTRAPMRRVSPPKLWAERRRPMSMYLTAERLYPKPSPASTSARQRLPGALDLMPTLVAAKAAPRPQPW